MMRVPLFAFARATAPGLQAGRHRGAPARDAGLRCGGAGNGNRMDETPDIDRDDQPAPEDLPDAPGAEGGSRSAAADKLPAAPADDDSPLGDTDQHSDS